MRTLGKILLWVLMVVLFVALVVGGAVGYFYYTAVPGDTTAAELTLWQSSFLAGLPQTPAEYDIYTNREVTLNRNKTVLLLMYQLSNETNCIRIGESHADGGLRELLDQQVDVGGP